jgi:DNA-binding MarR family transcriptional regulator
MGSSLKDSFLSASFRFKKLDACYPSHCCISLNEWVIMDKITNGCVCTSSTLNTTEIQTCIQLSRPAISQILNSLEKKGYIIRGIDSTDRRKLYVTATSKGNTVLKEAKTSYEQVLNEVVSEFGEEDMFHMIDYLNRLVDIYETVDSNNRKE